MQVGDVAGTLIDMFPDLAPLVADVLEACGGDSMKAFDRLQQMQVHINTHVFVAFVAHFAVDAVWGQELVFSGCIM